MNVGKTNARIEAEKAYEKYFSLVNDVPPAMQEMITEHIKMHIQSGHSLDEAGRLMAERYIKAEPEPDKP